MRDRIVPMIVTVLVVGAAFLVGFDVWSSMAAQADEETTPVDREPVALDGTQWRSVGSESGTNETVYNTTGYQLRFLGQNNSTLAWQSGLNTTADDSYTVCTWGAVNDSSAARQANRTLLSVDSSVVLSYRNATGSDEWHAYVYDPSSGTSTTLTGSATTETTRSQMCVYRDGADLRLYENATLLADTTFAESGEADANMTTASWWGSVEETRTWSEPLNSSERNATVTAPTAPLPNTERTDRLYYDAGDGGAAYAFLAPGEPQAAAFTGAEWEQTGFTAHEMTRAADYEWHRVGPRLRPKAGGDLQYQPAAWVSYGEDGTVGAFTARLQEAVSLFFVVFPIMALVLIIGLLRVIGE